MNNISVYSASADRVAGMERRKRTLSGEDSSSSATQEQKRARMSLFIRLESESSLDSQEDTESVYSIQDKETDVARDTSDTDSDDSELGTGSELESGAEVVTIEYDVASLASDSDVSDYTTSGTENMNIQAAAEGAFAAVLFDTSLEPWETDADTSDGSTIFDAFDFVECRKDFWTCQQCNLVNDNPSYRYCEKCFQVRKTLFPPRPKPSRKRKHHDESRKRQQHADTLQRFLGSMEQQSGPTAAAAETTPLIPDLNFGDIVVPQRHLKRSASSTRTHDADSDSDIFDEGERAAAVPPRKKRRAGDSASTATVTSPSEDEAASKSTASDDAKVESCSQDSGIGATSTVSEASASSAAAGAAGGKRDSEMCIMCTTAPKNGIFLHASIGHNCCCYKCAVRVWKNWKRCPVCNCRANNVIKLYTC